MKLSFPILAFFSVLLTACASNPPSYLPSGNEPIVNVEANVAEAVEVRAKPDTLTVMNKSEQPLNLSYKLFWYDSVGVTQTVNGEERSPWLNVWLEPKQQQPITLVKPTPESENYRFYLRYSR